MPETLRSLNNPDKIAEAGERIYVERHKERLERESLGKFVAIDVESGEAYLGDYAEDALLRAKQAAPHAVLHLIRVGSPGAFRASFARSRHSDDWWGRSLRLGG